MSEWRIIVRFGRPFSGIEADGRKMEITVPFATEASAREAAGEIEIAVELAIDNRPLVQGQVIRDPLGLEAGR